MVAFGVINCQRSWCRIMRLPSRKHLTTCPFSSSLHLCRHLTSWFVPWNCWNSRCRQMWIQGRESSTESKLRSISSSWQINSRQELVRIIWSQILTRRLKKTSTKLSRRNNMICLTHRVVSSGARQETLASWPGRMVMRRGTSRSRRTRSLRSLMRSLLATERKRTYTECYSWSSPIARERIQCDQINIR